MVGICDTLTLADIAPLAFPDLISLRRLCSPRRHRVCCEHALQMRQVRHRETCWGVTQEVAEVGLELISLHLWGLCSLYTWKYVVWEHLVISNVDIKLYLEGGTSGLGPKGCLLLWGRAASLLPRQGHMRLLRL